MGFFDFGMSDNDPNEREKALNMREKALEARDKRFSERVRSVDTKTYNLNERESKLNERESKLNERDSDVQQKEANVKRERELLDIAKSSLAQERSAHDAEMKRIGDQITAAKDQLEKRRQEVTQLESNAKTLVDKKQKESLKEAIEKQIPELEARQAELEALSERIAANLAKVTTKEGEVARRELAVTEREQRADAGFADRATALATEARLQHEANMQEAGQLEARERELANEKAKLESAKEALRLRELEVAQAERLRDAGYADDRSKVDAEINGLRIQWQNEAAQKRSSLEAELTQQRSQSLSRLEVEISELREKRLSEITDAEEKERDRIRQTAEEDAKRIRQTAAEEAKRIGDEIGKQRSEWDSQREEWDKERNSQKTALKTQSEANEKKAGELSAKEDCLLGKEQEIQFKERDLEQRYNNLEDTVEERVTNCYETLQAEIQRLRESLRIQTELVGAFDQLKRMLGDKDPAEAVRELNSKTDELTRLREELATRPTEEMRDRYEKLEREAKEQKERAEQLDKKLEQNKTAVAQTAELRRKNSELQLDNDLLSQRAERWEGAANEAQAELKRLRNSYECPAEVEARYKDIEAPLISADKVPKPVNLDKDQPSVKSDSVDVDEISWLDGIGNACDKYGLHFPKRILYAFHTALKTAEWSPLTILAGVSGTGKSELPRLYSHFGGLYFESLSVQPNWDSKESLLGFFNSIDNKFDAQPVLRFLAQSQKECSGDYPGLKDAVCMVLLDEMNLAHPELYFAEFLSKLELRRGMEKDKVPNLTVNIGAGLPPYQLPLGRNVLWTGTMNQDETTKSLSDKVLDRSIVIHFPRPTELIRRLILTPLDENNRGAILKKSTFFKWFAQKSEFTEEVINPYKKFIETINQSLGVAGRAIGHRVWQSIEYYMANYPTVRAEFSNNSVDESALKTAMHTAFEDQLVQKVMPKLRGIDTRGASKTKCLDIIRGLLDEGVDKRPFNLREDFDLACELGYGQFIWQSANYLNEEKEEIVSACTTSETPIPNWFIPKKLEREQTWAKMSQEEKQKVIDKHNKKKFRNDTRTNLP